MDAKGLISQLADSARLAGRTLSVSTGAQRKEALTVIAAAIEAIVNSLSMDNHLEKI